MNLEAALRVADAVLYEGYALYPYRPSALKNHMRWQFGVVAPRAFSEATGLDAWQMRAECLLEPLQATGVTVRLRCLRLEARGVERRTAGDDYEPVESLHAGGVEHVGWDEGVPVEVEECLALDDLLAARRGIPITLPASLTCETLGDGGGVAGRYARRRQAVEATLTVSAVHVDAASPLLRLNLQVENHTAWGETESTRDEALLRSLVSTHMLIAAPGGEFLSLLEPPQWAAPQAAACHRQGCWPVLVGENGARDLMLASPIILYDYPAVAPESRSRFFDATEIDELLSLRTATLTEEEKRQARAADPRIAELLDQVDNLPPEALDRLHGAIRSLQPAGTGPGSRPAGDGSEEVAEAALVEGSLRQSGERVRIKRGLSRADAQDLFLEGREARIEQVLQDAEGRTHIGVVFPDDPAADAFLVHGRHHYFSPDELEPLPEETS